MVALVGGTYLDHLDGVPRPSSTPRDIAAELGGSNLSWRIPWPATPGSSASDRQRGLRPRATVFGVGIQNQVSDRLRR
jgi:hypothetical protein